jgi:hypothetical protein
VPTKNPRIIVALEKLLYLLIEKLSRLRGLSLCMVTRDLIREAQEIHEDAVLSTVAEERVATLTDRDTLTHDEIWGIEVPYHLRYHPDVRDKDLPKINRNIQKRIKTAIEKGMICCTQ